MENMEKLDFQTLKQLEKWVCEELIERRKIDESKAQKAIQKH